MKNINNLKKLGEKLPEEKQKILFELLELYDEQRQEDKKEARMILINIDKLFDAAPAEKPKVNKFVEGLKAVND